MNEERRDLLRTLLPQLPIFGGLTDSDIEQIVGLLKWQEYADGDVIAREGQVGTSMFVVGTGRCRILHEARDSDPEFVIAELGPGHCVGEMSLIEIRPRSATVRAIGDVGLFSLSNADFLHLYGANLPAYTLVVLNVARELSRRLRRANDVISDAAKSLSESWRRRL